MHHLQYNTSL